MPDPRQETPMVAPQLIAAIASALLMTGFAANEASHGGFAESMGLDHHHMTDHGGYHCAGPDETGWEAHVQHMHGNSTAFQDHCSGGHMQADHQHIGDGRHGPMGPDDGHMDSGAMGGHA